MTKKTDDVFLRRVIWLLLTLSISSAGGWIWTVAGLQSQVNHNSESVKEIKQIQLSMASIDKGVAVLVALAEERNKQQKAGLKRQDYIFGEQRRRSPMIAWIEQKMRMK